MRFVELDGGAAVFEIGSGSYTFAVDRVLGDLGEAADTVRAAVALVDELAGDLRPATVEHLRAQLAKLTTETAKAGTSYATGDAPATAADVHRALATAADLDRWLRTQVEVGRVPAGAARGPGSP